MSVWFIMKRKTVTRSVFPSVGKELEKDFSEGDGQSSVAWPTVHGGGNCPAQWQLPGTVEINLWSLVMLSWLEMIIPKSTFRCG